VSERSVGIGRASVRGVIWNGATFGLSKLVIFLTTIILARLLDPSDFGLLGIGLVVIGYLDFINDFGVSAAVIQHESDDEEQTANVAFWLNMSLGVALGALGFVLAGPIASFFNEPRAQDVIAVLALSFPLTSIGSIHEARVRRSLQFNKRVVPEVLKGAVSIPLAFAGYGVWSLVWGQLAGTLAAAIAYWVVFPWRPRWRFDGTVTRDLLGFGGQMTLVGLLGGLHKNIDYLVVGRRLGTQELGYYTMAFRMPQLLIESVVDITGQVAFPAFARVRGEPERLRSGLRMMLGVVGLVIVPLGLGLSIVSDPFIRVFYGAKWEDAIPVMQVLSLYMLVQSLSKTCGDVYKAMGRPSILNKLAILKLIVTIPLLVIAVPHGIVAVAVAQLASASILTVARLVLAARVVGAPLRTVVEPFLPSARAGGLMAAACLGAMLAVDQARPLVELLVLIVVGAVVYLGTVWIFDRDQVREVKRLARSPRKKRRARAVGSGTA
jgi:O-antigen/teichoic acid export membrane protein